MGEVKMRESDPHCLHCAIYDLVSEWVGDRRVDPTEAIQRVAEALGHLIGAFPDPSHRRLARKEAADIISEMSKRTAIDRLENRPVRGHG
jgi:hypothetical protein